MTLRGSLRGDDQYAPEARNVSAELINDTGAEKELPVDCPSVVVDFLRASSDEWPTCDPDPD